MKIIFAGTPAFAACALERLLTTEHQIVAVYTQPDRKAGRGQKLTASAVKQLAVAHGLPVEQPLDFKSSSAQGLAAQQQLAAYQADVMVVAAYGLILPQQILDTPQYGCLNIHASLLPRWRGAAPIQRAIQSGDGQTGITIMQMAKGLDTGDMLYQVACEMTASDTAASLHERLAELGATAIAEVLQSESQLLQLQAQRQVQAESLSCYAHKIIKSEARIDWTQSSEQIDRQIRAFNPTPVAYSPLNADAALRIWAAEPVAQTHQAQPGEILAVDKSGVTVACGGASCLHLSCVQWPGAKPLQGPQILQTQKLQRGQILA
jgi:methionyl-tRNA formyltransferase